MTHSMQWLLTLAASLLIASTACAAPKLQVTVSFSILADLVRVVGGDRVAVNSLVGPDEDAHVFEPKPADAKKILQSRLVVVNGLGFEPWMLKLVQAAGYTGVVTVASKGITARTMPAQGGVKSPEIDPHAWQNPTHTIVYVHNIALALSQLDAVGAPIYQRNAQAYSRELQELDQWAQSQISTIPQPRRKVITSHNAFGYFAAHYGVTVLAPQGISTDAEPGAKDVAKLIQQIQREKIKAVFLENMSNPHLLQQIAQDTGVKLGPPLYVDALSAKDDAGSTYLKLMHHNVAALVAGMQKN